MYLDWQDEQVAELPFGIANVLGAQDVTQSTEEPRPFIWDVILSEAFHFWRFFFSQILHKWIIKEAIESKY